MHMLLAFILIVWIPCASALDGRQWPRDLYQVTTTKYRTVVVRSNPVVKDYPEFKGSVLTQSVVGSRHGEEFPIALVHPCDRGGYTVGLNDRGSVFCCSSYK
jgi:hypothetical protein